MEAAAEVWFMYYLNTLPLQTTLALICSCQNGPQLWSAVSEQVTLYYSILPLECTTPTLMKSKPLSPSDHCAYKQKTLSAWKGFNPAWSFEGLANILKVTYITVIHLHWLGCETKSAGLDKNLDDNTVAFPAVLNDQHVMIAFSRECQWRNPNRLAALSRV